MARFRYFLFEKISGLLSRLLICVNKKSDRIWSLVHSPRKSELFHFFTYLRPQLSQYSLIRIGPDYDGGYLLPNDLVGVQRLFSPGVGNNSEFEYQMAKNYGIPSSLIDASVSGPALDFSQLQEMGSMLSFRPLFLNPFTSTSYTDKQISLEDWILLEQSSPEERDYILQMDIDGPEWEVLLSVPSQCLSRFRILVIEFHLLSNVMNKYSFETIYNPVLKRLNELFACVHVHVNNATGINRPGKNIAFPDTIEVTYLRRDRSNFVPAPRKFIHELDRPCDPNLPELSVYDFWPFNQI